jgi:small GTP-binding protein
MVDEFDYLCKVIIIGDNEVGKATLFKYLNKLISKEYEHRALERVEEIKKGLGKEIDDYLILSGKTKSHIKRKVISHKIDKLIERKTTLEHKPHTSSNISTMLTHGVDFSSMNVKFRGDTVKLQIWILSTQERFRSIFPMYIRGSLGAIIIYDITNLSSLNRISEWCETIRENCRNIPIILVGNKLDLEELREVSIEQAIKIKTEDQISDFMEISVNTGEKVETIFERLTQLLMT